MVNVGFMLGILLTPFIRQWIRFSSLFVAIVAMLVFNLLLLYIQSPMWIPVCAVLSALPIGAVFGTFISIPSQINSSTPKMTSYMMSLFWCITFIMVTINLWIMGKLVDVTGSFSLAFAYMCAIFIPSFVGYLILKKKIQ